MKKLFFCLLICIAFPLKAETGGYWSLGGSAVEFDDSVDSITPKNIYGRIGYNFNDHFGIGGDFGFSLIEDDISGVDFGVDTTFLFVKGAININESVAIYGMIGPTNVGLTATVNDISASADDNDNGLGFGIEILLESGSSFHIEHITFFDKNNVEVTGLNIGIVRYF